MAAVVVPAHDEARVIGRLLAALVPDGAPRDLDVLVVANGCTDDTAEVAAGFAGARVISTPVPGKASALRLGDATVTAYPRVYVDADVQLGRDDVLALCWALEGPGVLIASPSRRLLLDRVSLVVRLYYSFWEQLPAVREGAFGRGVVALSRAGHERVSRLPEVMADDLAMSAAFEPAERRIVAEAQVLVRPPRTWGDLMRRRVRAVTGTRQVYEGGVATVSDSRTRPADLLAVVRHKPSAALGLPVFLAVAVLARRRARAAVEAGDYTTWLRDESSRV